MPAFNAAAFIEEALHSVLASTLVAIEILVVDDCSTDATRAKVAAIQKADPRVRLIALQRNGGVAAARNVALREARGEWLAVVDSDDLTSPGRLEAMVAAGAESGADLIADNLVVFEDGHPETASRYLADATARWITLADYLAGAQMFSGGADYGYLKPLMRLSSIRKAGVQYDETLRIAEDDDLIVRALLAGLRYRYEPVLGYGYRRNRGSTSFRLSAANAGAIVDASARICSGTPDRALLARHRRFERAHAFAWMVEALKTRRIGDFLSKATANPSALPLLRLPLMAALKRVSGWQEPPPPPDPEARAILEQMIAAVATGSQGQPQ